MTPEQRIILSMREAMIAEAAKPPLEEPQHFTVHIPLEGEPQIFSNPLSAVLYEGLRKDKTHLRLVVDNTGGPDAA